MKRKKTVLIFTQYYLPGYRGGGPIRTIANLVSHLGDEFEFKIVTSDRDMGSNKAYSNVCLDTWITVGKAKVYYLSAKSRSILKYSKILKHTKHDVVYLNSFFSFPFTIKPLVIRKIGMLPNRPWIIAPRGEFSANAQEIKWMKKRLYVAFAKFVSLYKNIIWQASSSYEKSDIERVLDLIVARNVVIAPNLHSVLEDKTHKEKYAIRRSGEPLKIYFLSRISPMKNLDYALKVLSKVRVKVTFDIYGPKEDIGYWKACEELIDNVSDQVQVNYIGPVDYNRVSSIHNSYDLFFLPTRGENFGQVILEALVSGTPVLISDATPWRGLQENGAGWDLPLSREDLFVRAISEFAEQKDKEVLARRKKVRSYAIDILQNSNAIELNRNLFRKPNLASVV